jgi:hypothetical protein
MKVFFCCIEKAHFPIETMCGKCNTLEEKIRYCFFLFRFYGSNVRYDQRCLGCAVSPKTSKYSQ